MAKWGGITMNKFTNFSNHNHIGIKYKLGGMISKGAIKNSKSTKAGDIYDVRYINNLVGNIESTLKRLRGVT